MKQNSNKFFFDTKSERNKNKNLTRTRTRTKTKTQQDALTNANNKTRTWKNYKEKELDMIELVSRAEALISDDVILTRSRSLDTSYRVLNDATSSKGR